MHSSLKDKSLEYGGRGGQSKLNKLLSSKYNLKPLL